MAVSKKQQACVARYSAKNYDQLLVRVKKGRRDEIQAHAEAMGESVNAFIGRAIAEAMERDNSGTAAPGVAPVNQGFAEMPLETAAGAEAPGIP